jgi:hypothetical protein
MKIQEKVCKMCENQDYMFTNYVWRFKMHYICIWLQNTYAYEKLMKSQQYSSWVMATDFHIYAATKHCM